MDEQRAKARAAWAGSGEAATERVWFDLREKVGATEFLGYDTERPRARSWRSCVDGKEVDVARRPAQTGWLVVNQTPFYGECGGQSATPARFSGADGEASRSPTRRRSWATCMHLGHGRERASSRSATRCV